ncbi:MAG: glycosyl hydrolase [Akkermansiaceae bacterium]|jgi:hypothetical protein|nr:glycosyl hydrolase [Akkermansiaceae bacterium]
MKSVLPLILLSWVVTTVAEGRCWLIQGVPDPVEAEFVGSAKGFVILRAPGGASSEVPLSRLSAADRRYVERLVDDQAAPVALTPSARPLGGKRDFKITKSEARRGEWIEPAAGTEWHFTAKDQPLPGSTINFISTDGWVVFPEIPPSKVEATLMDHFLVNGGPAKIGVNLRLAAYGHGCVVMARGDDFPGLWVYPGGDLQGKPTGLKSYQAYNRKSLPEEGSAIVSFVLKRGHTATLAENEDGTGVSRNWVAQDHDVVIDELPKELAGKVSFVRVFPWRWTVKKGIAGAIHGNLKVGWFYDWNIGQRSTPDIEYVAIRQNLHWPGLDQDWRAKGINHLLGFNEPDRPDQANMSVDQAIAAWPTLLKTGLRLGSPAPSDGGLGWLYEFMDKADKRGLRVDFVAVHYYRAVPDPGDGRNAAAQFKAFLQDIHNRTRRPIWITEWNNGANWTPHRDPNPTEQKRAIEAMIEMLDETPWVERYAPFNWVEDSRKFVGDKGALTPAGEMYRDHVSPIFFQQPR